MGYPECANSIAPMFPRIVVGFHLKLRTDDGKQMGNPRDASCRHSLTGSQHGNVGAAMKISHAKRIAVIFAYLGVVAYGFGGSAVQAGEQSAAADEELRQRVAGALHDDRYFYDEHVSVSVDNGVVVLRGFVASAWDLQDAIRIASKAAGDRRVIDDLSIKQGGTR
jgi:hypothetical protein